MFLAMSACLGGFLGSIVVCGRAALPDHPPSGWLLLPLSGALGLIAVLMNAVAAWVLSSLCVASLGWMNRGHIGGLLVTAGATMNLLVVALNGGMPVAEGAARSVGHPLPAVMKGFHQRLNGDSTFGFLGDVVAIVPLGEAFSIGDLVLAAGCGAFVFSASLSAAKERKDSLVPAWDRRAEPRADAG